MLSIFSSKKATKLSKDEDGKLQLVGYIDRESGRQSIYGYLLDKITSQSRTGILCIDDDIYEIECNIYHESIEKKYGHGNHGYKLYIPLKHKDGKDHIIKLIDKQTWTVCAERKIQLQTPKRSVNLFNDAINIDSHEHIVSSEVERLENIQISDPVDNKTLMNNDFITDNYADFQGDKNTSNIIGKIVSLDERKYLIVKPNNKNEHCISLQNVSTGFYLQHQDGRVVESNGNSNSTDFEDKSSFIPESRGDGFVLRCSNKGFEESYICKLDIDTYIVSEDLVEYVFYAFTQSTGRNAEPIVDNFDDYRSNEELFGCMIHINDIDYLVVPANDDNSEHISLLNIYNGFYVLSEDNKLTEKPEKLDDEFKNNSSFIAEFHNKNIKLHCIDKNSSVVCGENNNFIIGERANAFSFSQKHLYEKWKNIKDIISSFGRISIKIKN